MKVIQATKDAVLIEFTQNEAVLLGCLEQAWTHEPSDEKGPPGKFWYHNVFIAPALRAVAAFTEIYARLNGVRLALDEVEKVLRADGPSDELLAAGEAWLAEQVEDGGE